jgi:hypothetical protein
MIIDVTRKPLLVLPDEILDSVVVRSIGNRECMGIVTYVYARRWQKDEKLAEIDPGAKMTRGDATCFETRLILPGARGLKKSPYDILHDYDETYPRRDFSNTAREKEATATILPEPYEVASAFKDPITGFGGTWRLGFRVEKHKNGKTWLVTVIDVTQGVLLCTVAAKNLDPNPTVLETLPLARATRNIATGTAWDRILEDD